METREEVKARLRDLIGAKRSKRTTPPTCVNLRHATQLGELVKNEREMFLTTQDGIRQFGGEMLNMSGPQLHT